MESSLHGLEIMMARLEEKLKASNTALDLAKVDIDRRLNAMNELRDQINIERASYLTRKEFEGENDSVVKEVHGLQRFQWMMTGALLVLQILVAVVMHFLSKG